MRVASSPEFWGSARFALPRLEMLKCDDVEATRRSLSRLRGFRRSSAYNVDPEGGLDDSTEAPVIIHPLKARSSSPAVLRKRQPSPFNTGSAKELYPSSNFASGEGYIRARLAYTFPLACDKTALAQTYMSPRPRMPIWTRRLPSSTEPVDTVVTNIACAVEDLLCWFRSLPHAHDTRTCSPPFSSEAEAGEQ